MEITKAERMALAVIVNSGRAAVEVEMVATVADDGGVTAHGRRDEATGGFAGHFGIGGDESLDAQTAERLRDRGLVELWPVGIVKIVEYGKRQDVPKRKFIRPSHMATLTPLAAKILGVKLATVGSILRWTGAGDAVDPADVIDDPATPFPEPLPELEKFPTPPKRGKRNRPAF